MTTAGINRRQAETYQKAHPEVDWDTHTVIFGRNEDGNWKVVGHRVWTAEDEKLLAPCCGGACPIHAGRD